MNNLNQYMKHLISSLLILFTGSAMAQWQINPQVGGTFQEITKPVDGVTYAARSGFIVGVDGRWGDRAFLQPGAFFTRNATFFQYGDSVLQEGQIMRSNIKFKLMGGYRVLDSYQCDLRIALGPSYERVVSRDVKDTDLELDDEDFNDGLWNVDLAVGVDIGHFTVEPSASFGLSRVYNDDQSAQAIDSRYLTYALTLGFNFGDDDASEVPAAQ